MKTTTYYVVGTYPDGLIRTWHVTTANVKAYAESMLAGLFPFATITTDVCDDCWTCDHTGERPSTAELVAATRTRITR